MATGELGDNHKINKMCNLHQVTNIWIKFLIFPIFCAKFLFLAHLVMSLCNHALSVMWWWCCRHLHHHQHLCTALPVTALIIKTSYLANMCSYTPNICTWKIRSMWYIYFKWQPFWQIPLCGSPGYMVKLRAFIFGSVMHLYWGYLQGRNYASVNNILKVTNF